MTYHHWEQFVKNTKLLIKFLFAYYGDYYVGALSSWLKVTHLKIGQSLTKLFNDFIIALEPRVQTNVLMENTSDVIRLSNLI